MSFFRNHGPFKLSYLLNKLNLAKTKEYSDNLILSVSNLVNAKKNEITFFDNLNYEFELKNSKASYCLIKNNYSNLVPRSIVPIYSKNPLLDFIILAKEFFPNSCYDKSDFKKLNLKELKKKLNFLSENLVIANSVKIGKNVKIGHNTIIKNNCILSNNVQIGSNCVISNCIIGDNTEISDNSVIGKKGFGFKKIKNKIEFIPHFGKVLIGKNCFIGSCVTVDRGSFSDTIIKDNTFIDNHTQIAHNVTIGNYCFIAAQVGVAGSTNIGDNCLIGGQSGISGHLTIGDNVNIGGGSGVVRNLKNNERVMGYPATNFKNFLRKNKDVN